MVVQIQKAPTMGQCTFAQTALSVRRTMGIGCLVVLSSLAFAKQAHGEVPRAANLQEVGSKNIVLLSINCELLPTGNAVCTFSNAHVTKPSSKDIQDKLAEIDSPPMRTQTAKELKRCKSEWAWIRDPAVKAKLAQASAAQQQWMTLIVEACNKQDVDLALAAQRLMVSRVDAETCKVFLFSAKTHTFRKVSENEWESSDHGLGGTVLMTIWREPGASFWNYRELRAGEPGVRAPGVVEFRWDAPEPKLSCPNIGT